ncbi:AAA family ATPase [Streptomyces sp. B21-083]|uniref:AAA family ATPase n=1 Tax=Streptomyces sp. B21-083 TaxID=3039410 RepID=UPI002FEE8150
MLESLTLTNFKAFASQELRLAPFTLLTGLNSSGKSSVLQSLALLRQSYESGDLALIGDRDAGLLLNDELVQLGTGQDVRHESYDDTGPHISLAVQGDGAAAQWTALYEREADHLKLLQDDDGENTYASVEPASLLPTLFGAGFQYLKADRVSPQVSYPRSHHAVTTRGFLGPHGEHTVNYLRIHQDEPVVSGSLILPNVSSTSLLGQTQAWMQKLCPGVNLKAEDIARTDTVRLSYSFGSGAFASNSYRPTNVGFGLTYALPIVVACLSAKPGTLILLENPEAHLHPQGQTWMAYLASAAAASGAQIVMETHSDHVLNGLRISVKNQQIRATDTSVHFFRRKEQTSEVLTPVMGVDGMLSDWPRGFFDEWENSLDQLLD